MTIKHSAIAKQAIDRDKYKLSSSQVRWESWQASRQALANEEVTTAPFLKVD